METECLSPHTVTMYPLVLKRTKKKNPKQQWTTTLEATVTVAQLSMFDESHNQPQALHILTTD